MRKDWKYPALMMLAASLSACAMMPRFIWYPYERFNDSIRFSFERPKQWRETRVAGGVEYRDGSGKASFAITFLQEGDPGYKPAEVYRKSMYDWGSVEDNHIVSQITISSHTAYQVIFTAHRYDPEYLVGVRSEVTMSEVILVPESDGIYAVRYVAPQRFFWKKSFRRHFKHFLDTLTLAEVKGKQIRLQ